MSVGILGRTEVIGKDIICILVAYLLGSICTGYYFVRFKAKVDIREQGSGGVGARNVGRLLGRPGFLITLLGDGLKGVLAILLARKFELSESMVAMVLVAVIMGHIWPLPLQFRGGRGISTAIGAYLAYDPFIVALLLALALGLMIFRRGFILSGLGAFLLLPVAVYALKLPEHTIAALTGSAVIILFAHRERIRRGFTETRPPKEV